MQVGCPSCGTKYVLPPHQARPGVKARCKRCGALFSTVPDQPPATAAVSKKPENLAARSTEAAAKSPPAAPAQQESQPEGGMEPWSVGSPWTGVDRVEPESDDSAGEVDEIGASEESEEESEDDPFGFVLPPEPPPSDPREPQARAVGLSAIRAQSQRGEAPDRSSEIEDVSVERKGWLVRLEDRGEVISFRDLVSVRAWMNANSEMKVKLSSDGVSWRSPEEILDLVGELGEAGKAARAPTGRGRAVSAATVRRRRRAGPAWITAMALSTISMLLVAALTVQNLGLLDLGGVLPFEAMGLRRLIWSSEGATGGRIVDLAPGDRYRAAVMRGDSAKEGGRLLDAVVAYELALESQEGREALERLSEIYQELGDGTRAGEMERRLGELAEDGGVSPPRDG